MAEYIEREKVDAIFDEISRNPRSHIPYRPDATLDDHSRVIGAQDAIAEAKSKLRKISTADVRSERHGRWIKDGDVLVCSECGEEHAWGDYRATYCEDCGAKMDRKGSE